MAGMQWFLFNGGVCASNHFETGGLVKSDSNVSHPDIEMQFLPLFISEAGTTPATQHGFQVHG